MFPLFNMSLSLISVLSTGQHDSTGKKVNRKVQEEPQAEAAANPRHQEEEKKKLRLAVHSYQTNAQ